MTPELCAVSQVSHEMQWERVEIASVQSAEGYRILALCSEGVWCYSAFGPDEKIVHENGSSFFRGREYKIHYEMGERVPPAYSYRKQVASELIGCFHEHKYGGTGAALAAAKEACAVDLKKREKL